MFNHHTLRWQFDYRGRALQNLRLLVCDDCLDKPNPQLKPRIITPDPVPIQNARPNTYAEGYAAKTASYTIVAATDQIINCTTAGITITLPTAVSTDVIVPTTFPPDNNPQQGQTFTISNTSTGNITIDTTGGQTIGGAATYTLASNWSITVWSDGANWQLATPINVTVDGDAATVSVP